MFTPLRSKVRVKIRLVKRIRSRTVRNFTTPAPNKPNIISNPLTLLALAGLGVGAAYAAQSYIFAPKKDQSPEPQETDKKDTRSEEPQKQENKSDEKQDVKVEQASPEQPELVPEKQPDLLPEQPAQKESEPALQEQTEQQQIAEPPSESSPIQLIELEDTRAEPPVVEQKEQDVVFLILEENKQKVADLNQNISSIQNEHSLLLQQEQELKDQVKHQNTIVTELLATLRLQVEEAQAKFLHERELLEQQAVQDQENLKVQTTQDLEKLENHFIDTVMARRETHKKDNQELDEWFRTSESNAREFYREWYTKEVNSLSEEIDKHMNEKLVQLDSYAKQEVTEIYANINKILHFYDYISKIKEFNDVSYRLGNSIIALLDLKHAMQNNSFSITATTTATTTGTIIHNSPFIKELQNAQNLTQIKTENLQQLFTSEYFIGAATNGAKSLETLQNSFDELQNTARRQAAANEKGLKMFVSVVRDLTTAPPVGLVPGTDTPSILSRARYHIQRGSLARTLNELNSLDPVPKEVFSAWINDANQKLSVENGVSVLEQEIQNLLQQITNQRNLTKTLYNPTLGVSDKHTLIFKKVAEFLE